MGGLLDRDMGMGGGEKIFFEKREKATNGDEEREYVSEIRA